MKDYQLIEIIVGEVLRFMRREYQTMHFALEIAANVVTKRVGFRRRNPYHTRHTNAR